jgi:histidine ammonia-lyase
MPASVFSRSTECHNQDKVSMGTIAARDCLRVLQLTEQVAAAVLLAACQGLELRQQAGNSEHSIEGGIKITFDEIRARHPFLAEDRALEGELRELIARIQQQGLSLY